MSNIVCREVLGVWSAWYCGSWDYGAVAMLSLLVLAGLFIWLSWRRSQCRKMQRIRGSSRNGPAVLAQTVKGEQWIYSRYLKWKGRIFISPRPGYDIDDAAHDLESLADALGLRGSARPVKVEHNDNWLRVFGFRFVARPDLTRAPMQQLKTLQPVRPLQIALGTDDAGQPVNLSFRDGAAGAIVGGSGCGKSVLLAHIARECAQRLNFKVTLIDPHEVSDSKQFPGARVLGRSLEDWLTHYRTLDAELTRRLAVLKEKGVCKWTELLADEMQGMLTCVDECHELLSPALSSTAQKASDEQKAFAELQRLISKIAAQGRKAGVIQVFVGQSAYTADWSLSFTNMTLFKAAFALPNESLSTSFLGVSLAADPSLRHGRFALCDSQGTRIVRISQKKMIKIQ